jgi:hypothetical protein
LRFLKLITVCNNFLRKLKLFLSVEKWYFADFAEIQPY